jgi:predicted Zn-dependent protease
MSSIKHWIQGFWLPLCLLIAACTQVPITGRSQLSLIPASSINAMSAGQYAEFLAGHKVVENTRDAMMVRQVGLRIQDAVERFYREQNMANALEGYEWEFNLVEDPQVNAWCMPGGKVVVYTGILPVTRDEIGLAVVMGHEIAHALANHGNERMSQGLLAEFGAIALDTALESQPEETRGLFMAAYGLGAQVGILLPYSRLHESEADHLGLIFMAMAGYDPRASVDFWGRMAAMKSGGAPPEFLSTHPSDQTRIQQLQALLPEALGYYAR